jgi:hypothetical protein
MKLSRALLLVGLLLSAPPTMAAISPAHSPGAHTKAVAIEGADKLISPDKLIRQSQQTDQFPTDQLPMECRGYYVRPHKVISLKHCE